MSEPRFTMGQRVYVKIYDIEGEVSSIARGDIQPRYDNGARTEFTYRVDFKQGFRVKRKWAHEELLQTIVSE